MTGINEADFNLLGTVNNTKLFAYKIKYNNPESPSYQNPKYNGNISEIDWRYASGSGIMKRYNYQYDGLNRLSVALFSNPDASIPNNHYNDESLEYDLNGNITQLSRNAAPWYAGTPELIDHLNYTYTGNRLTQINDQTGNPSGYEGGGGTIPYDANGNMTAMPDKLINQIGYNHLNLPNAFSIQDNQRNQLFLYRADGVKQRKIYKTNKEDGSHFTTITHYLDGFHYLMTAGVPEDIFNAQEFAYEQEAFIKQLSLSPNEATLTFFPTAEGFFDMEKNVYIYNYKPSEAVRRFH
jgi:hypothetical protein